MTKYSAILVLMTLIAIVVPILVMVVIRLIRPGFVYHWLIASVGSLFAWLIALFIAYDPPVTIQLGTWQPKLLGSTSPILLIDQISWSFAAAIVTLAVGVIFTDVSRPDGTSWSSWTGILVLTAIGLLAAFAGNPLTILITWMLLDLAHFIILLKEETGSDSGRYLSIDLAFRFMGTIILMIASIFAVQSGEPFTFTDNSPTVISLLILAVFFRVGSYPYHSPITAHIQSWRSLGTIVRLVPVASALVLLPRIAVGMKSSGLQINNEPILLFIIGCLALLAGIIWLLARDEIEGRPYWILTMTLLAIASTISSEPEAAAAWGLTCVLTGGLIFMASFRDRRILWIPLLGVFMLSALPFSPSWNAANLFNLPLQLSHLLYFFTFIFLQMGYIKQAINLIGSLSGLERWVWLVYPMGLISVLVTDFWLGWQYKPALSAVTIMEWIVGPLAISISIGLLLAFKRLPHISATFIARINTIFSLEWTYQPVNYLFLGVQRITFFITRVLEGEGGILWSLLWVAVILAILGIQFGG